MSVKTFSSKLATPPKTPQKTMPPEEMNQRIRKVAQEMSEKRGRAPGHELEYWLAAERQVKREMGLE